MYMYNHVYVLIINSNDPTLLYYNNIRLLIITSYTDYHRLYIFENQQNQATSTHVQLIKQSYKNNSSISTILFNYMYMYMYSSHSIICVSDIISAGFMHQCHSDSMSVCHCTVLSRNEFAFCTVTI